MSDIIKEIRSCDTRDKLESALNKFRITDPQKAIDTLNECMYNPKTFFSSKPDSIEDELEFTKQMFLTGTWKINKYYERMKIKKTETVGSGVD